MAVSAIAASGVCYTRKRLMNTLAGLSTALGQPTCFMEVSFPIQVKEEWSEFLKASFDNNIKKVTKLY